MMFPSLESLIPRALVLSGLLLSHISAAAPVPETQAMSLEARGIVHSKMTVDEMCSVDGALRMTTTVRLTTALFWSNSVSIPIVTQFAATHKKEQLRDVWGDVTRTTIEAACQQTAKKENVFKPLSKAFATLASGEVWVLVSEEKFKAGKLPTDDPYLNDEWAILKSRKEVTSVVMVNPKGERKVIPK
ncbi:hypothetical protein BKA70DRAFT_1512677 [Coprinopsis sp. MPI-PUGE-AT-0042]|nr:hypothetical protein BKA70DRAFT_1512677 [Coprinopsis sp. MPI-PUGE-AT-0042]